MPMITQTVNTITTAVTHHEMIVASHGGRCRVTSVIPSFDRPSSVSIGGGSCVDVSGPSDVGVIGVLVYQPPVAVATAHVGEPDQVLEARVVALHVLT